MTWSPEPGSEGVRGTSMGWGYGIQVGDFLLRTGPNGGISPYRVESISYFRDPPDMWKATLVYDPEGCGKTSDSTALE